MAFDWSCLFACGIFFENHYDGAFSNRHTISSRLSVVALYRITKSNFVMAVALGIEAASDISPYLLNYIY